MKNSLLVLQNYQINTRIIIASLWIAMLFVFAYVDIFSLFRADVLQNALAGKVFTFEANQSFFLMTLIFTIIPTLLIPITLIAKAKISRWLNIIFPILYIVMIAGSMIGETWFYYLLGSVVEIILLVILIAYAWKWPRIAR